MYHQRIFIFESVAGESSDVWDVICARIPFPSCPTQMSAFRVSTDNLITQKPLIYCLCRGMLHLILHFNWLLSSDLRPTLSLRLHLFSHLFAIPFLCLHPYLHQPHLPFSTLPLFSFTLPPYIVTHLSLCGILAISLLPPFPLSTLSLCLSPPSQQCSGYTIAVIVVGGGVVLPYWQI